MFFTPELPNVYLEFPCNNTITSENEKIRFFKQSLTKIIKRRIITKTKDYVNDHIINNKVLRTVYIHYYTVPSNLGICCCTLFCSGPVLSFIVLLCLHCLALLCIVLYCLELFCFVLHYPELSCIRLSCIILHCPVLSCSVVHYPALSCVILFSLHCPVLSCVFLFCPALSCTVLCYPILS